MNGMHAGLNRALDRIEDSRQRYSAAVLALRSEYLSAARSRDPAATVRTPIYRQKTCTLAEAILEDLREDEQRDVVRLLLDVASGEPITDTMRLGVNVLIAALANRHADRHAEELAGWME